MKLRGFLFLILFAIALAFILNMCKENKYLKWGDVEKVKIDEVYNMHAKSDSLIDELMISVDTRDSVFRRSVDSLQGVIDCGQPIIIKKAEGSRDAQSYEYLSSPLYMSDSFYMSEPGHIKIVDTIIYNIILVDSFVSRVIYKIDTIYYDGNEIKKLKLRK